MIDPEPQPHVPAEAALADMLFQADVGLVAAHEASARPITSVLVYDANERRRIPSGALVLAVGLRPDAEATVRVIEAAAHADAAGVVVRVSSQAEHEALSVLGAQHDVTTIAADAHTDWLSVVEHVRAATHPQAAETLAGIRVGDLFAFSNVVARATRGATAVVDVTGHVLGFSTLPSQRLDELRRRTTLYLTEPEPVADDPDYRRVYATHGPVRLVGGSGTYDRVAVAIRSEGEILGSIWVLVAPGRTWSDVEEPLRRFLDDAAVHLRQSRETVGIERSREAALFQSLLSGDDPVADSDALALGDRRWFRIAVAIPSTAGASLPRALAHTLASWIRIVHENAVVTEANSLLVFLLSGEEEAEWQPFLNTVERFLRDSEAVQRRVSLLVSTAVDSPADLPSEWGRLRLFVELARTLTQAERLAPVVQLDDHWAAIELTALADLYQGKDAGRIDMLDRIREHDREYGTGYWETINALVDCDRNIAQAAVALHVHANTIRHRIERIQALFRLDCTNFSHLAWVAVARRLVDPGSH